MLEANVEANLKAAEEKLDKVADILELLVLVEPHLWLVTHASAVVELAQLAIELVEWSQHPPQQPQPFLG